jgi:exopolysaccharide biosynthesis polyprenyl glycosylphosphotransferase
MSDMRTVSERLASRRSVPFLLPLQGKRPRWHYLLEGSGWVSLRLTSDLVAGIAATLIAAGLNGGTRDVLFARSSLAAFPLLVVLMLLIRGRYARHMRTIALDDLGPVAGAVSVAAMLQLSWDVFVQGSSSGASTIIGWMWLLAVPLVFAGRAGLALGQRSARARGVAGRSTVIVGAGFVGAQVARRLSEHPEYGLNPIGFLDADPIDDFDLRSLPVLGTPDELEYLVRTEHVEHVIIAFTAAPDYVLIPLVRTCEQLGVEVSLVPRFFESINDRVAMDRLGSLPLFGLRSIDPKGWQFRIKYALDRPAAALAILVMAPILLAVAVAVRISSPGPVLFRQRRIGRDGTAFDLLKFRSMVPVAADDPAFLLAPGAAPGGIEGVDRRTSVGRFIRRTALDELPQLFNVLRGDMSMIGPRPERPEFVDLFGQDIHRYSDRHRVKSGITGWAQVHGLRGQTSLVDRVEWDNFYIENWSLWLDCKVMLMTGLAVLRSGEDS